MEEIEKKNFRGPSPGKIKFRRASSRKKIVKMSSRSLMVDPLSDEFSKINPNKTENCNKGDPLEIKY